MLIYSHSDGMEVDWSGGKSSRTGRAEGRIMELKITSQQPWQEEARDVPGVDEMRATVSIYNYAEEVGCIINVHRAFVRGILDFRLCRRGHV